MILAASDASDFERMVARLVQADEHALLLMLSADAARSVPVFCLVLHGTFINKKVIIRSLLRLSFPSPFPRATQLVPLPTSNLPQVSPPVLEGTVASTSLNRGKARIFITVICMLYIRSYGW